MAHGEPPAGAATRDRTGSVVHVEDLRTRVDARLGQFLAQQRPVLEEVGGDLEPVFTAARDYLAGGKRLRAAFCYWGYRGAGGPADAEIVAAAGALELLQACALVHDDVMDASDTRRGRPSAHRWFEAMHAERGWAGTGSEFGVNAAILLGDLFLSWSDELFDSSGLDQAALHRAKPLYNLMRTELMAGQYLDLAVQARRSTSGDDARQVLRYKSAKYTVERPLQLGALLAEGGEHLLPIYSAYGLPLGEAFQLRDDLLGVFGDPAVTGKPAGDDLREGKRTVLVAAALAGADPAAAAHLTENLGRADLDADGVAALRDIIESTGARQQVEQRIEHLHSDALAALASPMLDPDARIVLTGLADAAVRRTA